MEGEPQYCLGTSATTTVAYNGSNIRYIEVQNNIVNLAASTGIEKSDQNNIVYFSPSGQIASTNQNNLIYNAMKQTDNSLCEVYRI